MGEERTESPAGTDNWHPPPRTIRSFALSGLFILAILYTLYFARLFLLPLVLAVLFTLLLSPAVRALQKIWIPAGLGAGLIVLGLVGLVAGTGYLLIDPAISWFERAPSSLEQLEGKLREFRKPVEQIKRTTEKVERLIQMGRGGESRELPIRVQPESLAEALMGNARTMGAGTVVTLTLLYFLLASGDLFLRKLIRVLPTLEEKKRVVEIARELNEDISLYLLTITLINIGLGVAEGTAMYLLGMPNPFLWGAMATLLNFIPYLGAMVGTAIVALAAALTFEASGAILLPPLAYYVITATEGNLITPLILGRRLTLNPVFIILGLIFWGWLWGIIGALLAVPLLVSFKIFCEHIPPLAPVGEFLER
jgi:predicted PurR-regulated permease PerM